MDHSRYNSKMISPSLIRTSWLLASIILVGSLLIAGAILLWPAPHPTHASTGPTLSVNPLSQAYFKNSKLRVQGKQYPPNQSVTLYWNYQQSNTQTVWSGTTSPTGTFSVSFLLPQDFGGVHSIDAVSGGVAAPPVSFTLQPNLIALPRATGRGSFFTLSGFAFGASETVALYWNCTSACTATPWQTLSTDLHGSLPSTTQFQIPANANTGSTPIFGVGETSDLADTARIIVYPPTLALAPLSGVAGTKLTLTAYGFHSSEKVIISWSGGGKITQVATNANGYMANAFPIPQGTSPKSYKFTVLGTSSQISASQTFTVVASSSRREAHSTTTPAAWTDFGFGPNHLRVNSAENTLGTGNVASLQKQWSQGIGTPQPEGAPSPIAYNGLVYIATFDGNLNAYNATTGTLVWQFNQMHTIGTAFANLTSPVIDPTTGLLFFGTLGYLEEQDHGVPSPFFALDALTGTLMWSEILNGDDYGFPTVAWNTVYVGLGNEGNGGLLALDEETGFVNGFYNAQSGIWGAVGVDTQTGMIFTGTANPKDTVLAFKASTFQGTNITPAWACPLPAPGDDDDIGSAMAVVNGTIYVDSKNGNMYALAEDPTAASSSSLPSCLTAPTGITTGKMQWTHPIGASSEGNVSSPAVDTTHGLLYVGSLDHTLYALRLADGSLAWKAKTKDQIYSSPALANGVVYVASNDGHLYAYNASGCVKSPCSPLWSSPLYTQTATTTFSSPIVVNGWLYCASDDGNLYAFSL